jgi:hypothetical protein
MVSFRYISVNTLHKGDDDDDDTVSPVLITKCFLGRQKNNVVESESDEVSRKMYAGKYPPQFHFCTPFKSDTDEPGNKPGP